MSVFVILLSAITGILALAYGFKTYQKIMRFHVENDRIVELSEIIHRGAMAFLYREYKWLFPFVIVVAGLLGWQVGVSSAVCFVLGALCSAASGFFGMIVATRANGRTSFAATLGVN